MYWLPSGVVADSVSPAPFATEVIGRQFVPDGQVGPWAAKSPQSKTQVVVRGSGGDQSYS